MKKPFELVGKKITLATVKSMIKNVPELFVKNKSRFDGMTDGIEYLNGDFEPVKFVQPTEYNLGIAQAWFVGRSRDWFTYYNNGEFEGIEVSNSCGYFIIARRLK